jgi:hypothetical protein
MKTKQLLCLLTVLFGHSISFAQVKFKVNYQEHERSFALIRDGANLEELNFLVLDQLGLEESWRSIETRVNQDYFLEHTYILDSTTYDVAYSKLPKMINFLATGFIIYNDDLEQIDEVIFEQEKIEENIGLANFVSEYGYHPGFPDFMRPSSFLLESLQSSGYSIDSTMPNQITITSQTNHAITYNDAENWILEEVDNENFNKKILKKFEYFNGVGFLLIKEIDLNVDKYLDTNVTFITERVFSEYQISDYAGILQLPSTVQSEFVRLFPVPIQGTLNIELINLPTGIITGIKFRNFQGDIVGDFQGFDSNFISVDASQLPTGLIQVEVITNSDSIYKLSFKN